MNRRLLGKEKSLNDPIKDERWNRMARLVSR